MKSTYRSLLILFSACLVLTAWLLWPAPTQAAACDTIWVGTSGNWSDPGNWMPGVPGSTDTACINVAAGSYTVTLDINTSIGGFIMEEPNATFFAQNRQFIVNGPAEVRSGDVVWRASTWGGQVFTNTGVIAIQGNATITSTLIQNGQMRIEGGGSGNAILTVNDSFVNNGSITLETIASSFQSNLIVAGILTNTNTIQVLAGTGGVRTINANLVNANGTIVFDSNTTLNKTNGVYTNDGAILIIPGRTLSISGGNQTFNQNGGNLSVGGNLAMSSANFNFNGGIISGAPTLNNVDLTIGPLATGSAAFNLGGTSTLTGDVKPGQQLNILGGQSSNATLSAANGFTNEGTIILETIASAFQSNLQVTNGVLTNTGIININAGTGGVRTVTANLVNNGDIFINDSTTFNQSGGLYTNNGLFQVESGHTLSISGLGQTFNQNGGTLTIAGNFRMSSATFNFNGGDINGTPTLNGVSLNLASGATAPATFNLGGTTTLTGDVKAGQQLNVRGGQSSNALLSATNSFNNDGIIVLETIASTLPSNLRVTNGVLTNTGVISINAGTGGVRTVTANLVNNGDVFINDNTTFNQSSGIYTNNGLFQVESGHTLSISGLGQTFNQNAGVLTIVGDFSMSSATFNFNGGDINGVPTLNTVNLNLGATATAPATFNLGNTTSLTGDVKPGQQLNVRGGQSSNALLLAAAGFTNGGTIVLETSTSSFQSNLQVTNGILTNTGVISINAGTGGTRNFTANLVNNGSVFINDSTTFNQSGGLYTNNGLFRVESGHTLSISGLGQTFNQNGGTLTVVGDFSMSSSTFNFNGGDINGTPTLNAINLNLGLTATAPVTFNLGNTSSLTGDVKPGQRLNVRGGQSSNARLMAINGFTNEGTIVLETSTSSFQSNLQVTNGTLTNTGTISINVGTGGARTFTANLLNNGNVYINTNTTFNQSSGIYTNNGSFNIASGRSLSISGLGQTFNQTNGTLTVDGVFSCNSMTFNYAGGFIAGDGFLDCSNTNLSATGTIEPIVEQIGGNTHPGGPGTTGIMSVAETYSQGNTTLHIELGGDNAGSGYDQLNVGDQLFLDGTLQLSLVNNFVPAPCQTFKVLTFGSRVGDFDTINGLDLGNGLFLRPVYSNNDLSLVAFSNTGNVNIHPTSLQVTEGGNSDVYRICLAAQPTTTTLVQSITDGQVTTNPPVLVFDSNNWDVAQAITVTAVDDSLIEGLNTSLISSTVTSGDPAFNNFPVPPVVVSITDNDQATLCINFQTAASPTFLGCLADNGFAFGDQGNNFTYGWDADNTAGARDRNFFNFAPDQRHDTLNHMQLGGISRTWEISLSNGFYYVHLVAGDPEFANGSYQIDVEGELTVSGVPNKGQHWLGGSAVVEVLDGRLTISNNPAATGNNKVAYIEITPLPNAPGSFQHCLNFQPGAAPTAPGCKVDSGQLFGPQTNGLAYGWNINNTSFARDRNFGTALDQRYDTLNHMQPAGISRTWEISVPNGAYAVFIGAGDPQFFQSHLYGFQVEGEDTGSIAPTNRFRSATFAVFVTVDDGFLTITNNTVALKNKIQFVEITQIGS